MSSSGLKRLDERVFVANRQIVPTDLADLAERGIRTIINNRPDGEEPGQPRSAEIEAAAGAAGIDYRHIPVAGGFAPDDIDAMVEALDQGPSLVFCRSGTRSTYLWALARAGRGGDPEALIARAAAAGYDLAPIAARLRASR